MNRRRRAFLKILHPLGVTIFIIVVVSFIVSLVDFAREVRIGLSEFDHYGHLGLVEVIPCIHGVAVRFRAMIAAVTVPPTKMNGSSGSTSPSPRPTSDHELRGTGIADCMTQILRAARSSLRYWHL